MKAYKRLSEEEWMLVRYAILRENATIKATAAEFGVCARTIANRRRAEMWDAIDPFKTYRGLPTEEEILEMRSRHVVNRTLKTINEKLGQIASNIAANKHDGAQDIQSLAGAAATLEAKLRRRAPSGAGASRGPDSVRAGRKAPSVEEAIAILNSRAARLEASGAHEDDDAK